MCECVAGGTFGVDLLVVCLIPVLSIVQMNGWKEEIDIERETDRKTERERER